MKRVWIAAGILVLVMLSGWDSLRVIDRSTDTLLDGLDRLSSLVYAQTDANILQQETEAFSSLWEEQEKTMMHFVRHNTLDEVSAAVAQLRALAAFEDYGDLAAQVERLRHLLEHIAASEKPSVHTIF